MGGGVRVGHRPARAVALAALCALLTTSGHLAGGGGLPDLAPLAVLLPLLSWLFLAVAGSRRGLPAVLATLGLGQLALHELMVLLHPHPAAGLATADGATASGWAMAAGHTAATLLVALGMHHADTALDALGGVLRRVLPRRMAPAPVEPPPRTFPVPAPAVGTRLARAVLAANLRRGPPVGC